MKLIFFILFFFTFNSLFSNKVFISKNDYMTLKDVQIIDVRNKHLFNKEQIKNSYHLDVSKLNDPKSIHSNNLYPKNKIEKVLQNIGLKNSKNILILGKLIHSWGEDGRIFWVLDRFYLGNVYLYNGGYNQFIKDFPHLITHVKTRIKKGDIVLKKEFNPMTYDDVLHSKAMKFDVRSFQEFLGATPFGSKHGGRIKDSKSLPWSHFFTPKGFLKQSFKKKVLKMLEKNSSIPIVYCTAGYRSALIYAVLKEWGIKSYNYDGSWYEYSYYLKQ